MKVLHVLDSLNRGGAEMLTLDVCRNAQRYGIDLIFVATGTGDLANEFAAADIDQIWLKRHLPVDPLIVKTLRKIVIDRSIKVVHAQQAVEAIHIYLATRGTKAKCVLTLHNFILDKKNRIATKMILPKMDAVCCVSESMQDWFRSNEGIPPDKRFHIVPNGVDPSRLKPTTLFGATTLRDEIGITKSDILLGMVGNFYSHVAKDQLTICRALSAVMSEIQNSHFVFVGAIQDNAQDYFDQCVQHCRNTGILDRVHFIGKRSDIPDLLRELDLFVFSSEQEGMPIAAIEALMLGVPMIVSDIPSLLEVIGFGTQQAPVAEIFRTGDHEDLAAKLKSLISNRQRLSDMGERARVQTIDRFGIDAHLKKLKTLYDKLAAS